jgi:Flp pilus assembly protein TadG
VEVALVYPLLLTMIIGVVILGVVLFCYQQVAMLAREGARYASVRGTQYAADNTGRTAATSGDIQTYVRGKAAGLDTGSLRVTTTWPTGNDTSTPGKNKVSVVVEYTWVPEAYQSIFGSSKTLTSTSVMTMSY